MSQPLPAIAAAFALALTHALAGRLHGLRGIPRSWWLSAAGGVSVAYVFLHLLPELAAAQRMLARSEGVVLGIEERHVYLVALVGITVFYGLDQLALESRPEEGGPARQDHTGEGVFWLHVGAFALYNLLIGYLLVRREDAGIGSLTLFTVAIGMHFLVNDLSLWEHHQERYDRVGRWVLAAAVLAGAGVGLATGVDRRATALLLALLAGGIVLNVLKEELPNERKSRFTAFAIGAAAYGALLLLI